MGLGLGLEEQIGAGIDEEGLPTTVAQGRDPRGLVGDVVEPIGADHLILEIAADRARFGEPPAVRAEPPPSSA